jgi:hypothetical protein
VLAVSLSAFTTGSAAASSVRDGAAFFLLVFAYDLFWNSDSVRRKPATMRATHQRNDSCNYLTICVLFVGVCNDGNEDDDGIDAVDCHSCEVKYDAHLIILDGAAHKLVLLYTTDAMIISNRNQGTSIMRAFCV